MLPNIYIIGSIIIRITSDIALLKLVIQNTTYKGYIYIIIFINIFINNEIHYF